MQITIRKKYSDNHKLTNKYGVMMANRFKIYYDCGINIPELFLQFDNDVCVHLTNHSVAEVELEPGVHDLFAAYQMVVDNQTMDFEKRLTAVVEEGFDYIAKICMVLKSFTWLKRFDGNSRCC